MIETKQQKGMKKKVDISSLARSQPHSLKIWIDYDALALNDKTNKHMQTPSNMLSGLGTYSQN